MQRLRLWVRFQLQKRLQRGLSGRLLPFLFHSLFVHLLWKLFRSVLWHGHKVNIKKGMFTMKKMIIENQEVVNLLEAEAYEVHSRQSLLAYMAQSGVLPDAPAFEAYHKEFQEHFIKYEAAKAEFEREYVSPLAPEGKKLSWTLDYASRELTVQGIDG